MLSLFLLFFCVVSSGDTFVGTVEVAAPRGTTSLLVHGEPQIVLSGLGGWPGVQLAPYCSTDGDDPLALCRDLNEENDATEKVLRGSLDRLLTTRQKVMVSRTWMTWRGK